MSLTLKSDPLKSDIRNSEVIFKDLGLISFKKAWDYQTELFESIISTKLENRDREKKGLTPEKTKNYLLFCEHPHTYTLGKSGKETNLLASQKNLESQGIDYYKINRGGDITYHGPGQLVCYPILDLENFFTDIGKYMRLLEEVVIQTLKKYDINGYRISKQTGVWVDSKQDKKPMKICAMGVKTGRWVTMHGIALNVFTDLNYFKNIVPCGISDKGVTSMKEEINQKIIKPELDTEIKKQFSKLFGIKLIE